MRGVSPSYRVVRDADQFVQLGGALAAAVPVLMNPASVARRGVRWSCPPSRPSGGEMIVSYPLRAASSIASNVSDSVPIWFGDQDAVGRARVDPFLEPLDVGDEQVVAADHRPVADPVGRLRERLVVVLVERVLDVREVVLVDEVGDVVDLLVGRLRLLAVDVRLWSSSYSSAAAISRPKRISKPTSSTRSTASSTTSNASASEIGAPTRPRRPSQPARRARRARRDCRVDRGVREDGLRDARCADGCREELLDVSRLLWRALRRRRRCRAESENSHRGTRPEVLVQRRTGASAAAFAAAIGSRPRCWRRSREKSSVPSAARSVVDGALVARIDAFGRGTAMLAGLRDGFVGREFDRFVLAGRGPLALPRGRSRRTR